MSTFLRTIDRVPHTEGSTEMLRGMSTVSLFADDVEAARDWYAQFRIQDDELISARRHTD